LQFQMWSFPFIW